MIGKLFKVIAAVIVAFLSIAIISQTLIFIGPFIGGVIVSLLNLSPDPQLAKTMESAGGIFVLIISVYAGIKVYKTIIGSHKENLSPEKQSSQ